MLTLLDIQEDGDFADSRMINAYRQQRLNELKDAAFRNRFGEVVDIVKNDWVREVTEGSNKCTVIVHLYEDCITECNVMDEALKQLAPKFKYLKFLRIKSTSAIENWPERNLPTLFVYEEGSLKTQVLTLNELDGKGTKAAGNPFIVIHLKSGIDLSFIYIVSFAYLHQTWSGICPRRASSQTQSWRKTPSIAVKARHARMRSLVKLCSEPVGWTRTMTWTTTTRTDRTSPSASAHTTYDI
jgi:hypothetical protein